MTHILAIPIEVRLAILFVLGCCAGAAVNLGIYRLAWNPRPIGPWSRPHPQAPPRRLRDRLPGIGWLSLRREAALHGAGFWLRPMLLELLCGAVFVLLYLWEVQWCGLLPDHVLTPIGILAPRQIALPAIRHEQFLAHIVLFCFMLVAFWIDVDEMTIPDGVTVPGTLLGLLIMSLWPYALLPQVTSTGLPVPQVVPAKEVQQFPVASSVWLTSPDDVPPKANDQAGLWRFVPPWEVPAVTGRAALAAAIAGFWAWCLALLPGLWSTRHGYFRAVRVFTARMVRERTTYGLLALAIAGSVAIAWVWSIGGAHWAGLASGLAGIVVGGGLVWIIRILASAVLHREAMGFGDVTLLAMIGAFLGWQAAIIIFFLAPLLAIVIGITRLLLHGEKEIPFGPFLCLAAAVMFWAWPTIWKYFAEPYFSQGWWLIAVLLGCLGLIVLLLPPVRWIVGRMRAGSRGQGAGS